MKVSHELKILLLIILGLSARFIGTRLIESQNSSIEILAIVGTFVLGVYLIQQTAKIIEETTGVLKHRTGLAGGLLQSLGTAFPDMVIGVVAALVSVRVASNDPVKAINLAIIAASTTFGSNIYNILHASWCVFRQNTSNLKDEVVLMFPKFSRGGSVIPMSQHEVKPHVKEIDDSMEILILLSLLTTSVALGMVLFGKVTNVPLGIEEDLYNLNRPLGVIFLFLSIFVLYIYRKSHHKSVSEDHSNFYTSLSNRRIWFELAIAGVIIFFAAESIVHAVTAFSEISGIPYVVTGVLTGLVGCLGEMIVVHNFTVHPKGRLGDAVIGVAMDNIVTTMGASFIAILGGVFLGGSSLIVIFVLILFANSVLIHQISLLKNYVEE